MRPGVKDPLSARDDGGGEMLPVGRECTVLGLGLPG